MSNKLDKSLGEIIGSQGRKGRKGRGRGKKGSKKGGKKGSGPIRRNNGGRNRKLRFNPYEHIEGGSIEDVATGAPENRCLKVGGESAVNKVAGAICECVRIGGAPPALLCTGIPAINQSVKAIAVARSMFAEEDVESDDDQTDFIVTPEFYGTRYKCVLRLRKAREINFDNDAVELTSTKNSDPKKVAGAIAGKIRDGERVGITGVGPHAVTHAVESIYKSREYLMGDRIDVKFAPRFEEVEVAPGKIRNAIHFAILSRRMGKRND